MARPRPSPPPVSAWAARLLPSGRLTGEPSPSWTSPTPEAAAPAVADRQSLLRHMPRLVADIAALGHQLLAEGEGGFTIDPRSGGLVRANVWAVSLHGPEARFPRVPSLRETEQFVWEHSTLLFIGAFYFGGWRSGRSGPYCLDVTRLFPNESRQQALEFAFLNAQEAITNLRTLKTVYLEQFGRRVA